MSRPRDLTKTCGALVIVRTPPHHRSGAVWPLALAQAAYTQ
jgi:hypothetical protein